MKTTMWKLKNSIKNYEWGNDDMINKLFHIDNPNKKPMAEVWMGAHQAGVSIAMDTEGNQTALDKLISKNPNQILGDITYQQYKTLPYLFKILSAKDSLSIQVHPERSKAISGYEKENKLGIPLNSPRRNYKDPNHKPELIYAITPFLAMNSFRPISEIISLFLKLNIEVLDNEITSLKMKPNRKQLKLFFHSILKLNGKKKYQAIYQLKSKLSRLDNPLREIIDEIIQKHPDDNGVFAPLLLNIVELQPGQAMFLFSQTPHAYLKGTGLEIMANSDNVLRAGLTTKFIDIDELLANTLFDSSSSDKLLTQPIIYENKIQFPIPVDDFSFEIIHSDLYKKSQTIDSAQIIFCIEGKITLSTSTDVYTIKTGESVFIAECAKIFSYQGLGVISRVFNK